MSAILIYVATLGAPKAVAVSRQSQRGDGTGEGTHACHDRSSTLLAVMWPFHASVAAAAAGVSEFLATMTIYLNSSPER